MFRGIKTIVFLIGKGLKSKQRFFKKISLITLLIVLYVKSKLLYKSEEASCRYIGMKIFAESYTKLLFLILEIFVNEDYEISLEMNNPIIFDCGANIGMATLYFKSKFPNSTVFAFEPNPTAFKYLKKNIEANNLSNVFIYNSALSDKDEKLKFFTPLDESSLVGSRLLNRGGDNFIEVDAVRLSSFIKELDDQKVDLVKIDVEGSETYIWEDLLQTKTFSKVSNYLIEYHHNIPDITMSFSQFLSAFEKNNYKYLITGVESYDSGFQDILVNAKLKNEI